MKRVYLIVVCVFAILLSVILIFKAAFFMIFDSGVFFSNPSKPSVTYGEFNFVLQYEINNQKRILSDTYVCEFDGYSVDEGRGKVRRWKGYFKNEQQNELYAYRIEDSKYTGYNNQKPIYNQIVLQNIDHYKVVFSIEPPEYFLNEPDYKNTSQMPYIQVYDINTGYYNDEKQSKEFLSEQKFKILSWHCDAPIENTFN